MDMALCSFDLNNKKVQYSGAFRPLIKINGDKIEEIKGDLDGIKWTHGYGAKVFK